MRNYPFRTPQKWANYVNNLLRQRDLDNLVLFAGEPGNGKSTFMLQIAKLLDESFSLERIHFTIPSFLEAARAGQPYQCIAGDEFLINRRRSMTGNNMELVDFLQVCRALNLHLLICFPHAADMDRAVLDKRVRYRIDVPCQGTAILSQRFFKTIRDISGREEYIVIWKQVSPPWHFDRNTGVFWEEYLAKKMNAARQREAEAKGQSVEEMDFEEAPIKGNRKIKDKMRGGPPKFLSQTGRHPKGCGKTFPCPTDVHV